MGETTSYHFCQNWLQIKDTDKIYIYFLNNLHVYYHIQQLEIIRRILTGGSCGRDRIW